MNLTSVRGVMVFVRNSLTATLFLLPVWATSFAGECCAGPSCNPPSDVVVQDPVNPWDTDRDSISTAVELNDANDHHNFDTTVVNANPSAALGTPTNGTLLGGINLPDAQTLPPGDTTLSRATRYVHHRGDDPVDYDDWGTLALINTIEHAGRHFGQLPCRFSLPETGPRAQFGDMSLQNGGDWTDHTSHENGRDVDVRYMRLGNEGQLDLAGPDSLQYDEEATLELVNCLLQSGRVELILYDSVRSGILNPPNTTVLMHDTMHTDHMHVRIVDPDGP